jgi:hypothetical protein
MRRAVVGCLALLCAAGLARGQSPESRATLPAAGPGKEVVAPEAGPEPETVPVTILGTEGPFAGPPCAPAGPAEPAEAGGPTTLAAYCWWVRAEGLVWWVKDGQTPPLVTGGSRTDRFPGALDEPGTTVLFGGALASQEHAGGRFSFGLWPGPGQCLGLEGSYLFLATRTDTFSASGAPNSSVLARPIFDVLAGRENTALVTFPGKSSGTVTVSSPTYLQGAEANGIWLAGQGRDARVELLAGFRYLDLNEAVDIGQSQNISPLGTFTSTSTVGVNIGDHFGTRNNFYGGQVGLRGLWRFGCWEVDGSAKVAIGDSHEVVTISGFTTLQPPTGPATTLNGGILALPSNSGSFSHDAFAVVPEVNLNVGYCFCHWFRAYVGYSLLYDSNVVRPGDQIDRAINPQQPPSSVLFGPLTGPGRPSFTRTTTDFWAQGVNFGVEFRY